MSSEIVKRALELTDEPFEGTSLPSVSKQTRKKGKREQSSLAKLKVKHKSVVETFKETTKVDHLKQNLSYLLKEKRHKTDLTKVKQLVDSYQNQRVDGQYWKEKQKTTLTKKRKKLPCVFTDEDFARLRSPNATKMKNNVDKSSVFQL